MRDDVRLKYYLLRDFNVTELTYFGLPYRTTVAASINGDGILVGLLLATERGLNHYPG